MGTSFLAFPARRDVEARNARAEEARKDIGEGGAGGKGLDGV